MSTAAHATLPAIDLLLLQATACFLSEFVMCLWFLLVPDTACSLFVHWGDVACFAIPAGHSDAVPRVSSSTVVSNRRLPRQVLDAWDRIDVHDLVLACLRCKKLQVNTMSQLCIVACSDHQQRTPSLHERRSLLRQDWGDGCWVPAVGVYDGAVWERQHAAPWHGSMGRQRPGAGHGAICTDRLSSGACMKQDSALNAIGSVVKHSTRKHIFPSFCAGDPQR